jgi:hypothetical protein
VDVPVLTIRECPSLFLQELVGGGGFDDNDFGFVCGNRVNLTAGTGFDIDDCKTVSNPSNVRETPIPFDYCDESKQESR